MIRATGRFGALRLLPALLRGVWPELALVFLLGAVSVQLGPGLSRRLTPDLVLPLLGIVTSVLVGFRATQAYGRWWEARTLWGQLRTVSRTWKAALLALSSGGRLTANAQRMLDRQVLLVWTVAAELRPQLPPPLASQRDALVALRERQGLQAGQTSQCLFEAQALDVALSFEQGQLEPSARVLLIELVRDGIAAVGGLERLRSQTCPPLLELLVRAVVWLFAWLIFLRLEADVQTPAEGNAVALVLMLGYVLAERFCAGLDRPLEDPLLGLPQHHFCATISRDLLGVAHPLAQPPQAAGAAVWT